MPGRDLHTRCNMLKAQCTGNEVPVVSVPVPVPVTWATPRIPLNLVMVAPSTPALGGFT